MKTTRVIERNVREPQNQQSRFLEFSRLLNTNVRIFSRQHAYFKRGSMPDARYYRDTPPYPKWVSQLKPFKRYRAKSEGLSSSSMKKWRTGLGVGKLSITAYREMQFSGHYKTLGAFSSIFLMRILQNRVDSVGDFFLPLHCDARVPFSGWRKRGEKQLRKIGVRNKNSESMSEHVCGCVGKLSANEEYGPKAEKRELVYEEIWAKERGKINRGFFSYSRHLGTQIRLMLFNRSNREKRRFLSEKGG